MTQFPSQSHASQEPRKIQPVTSGEAKIREAPVGRRMRQMFFQGSAKSVWGSMFWDTLLPGARDVFANGLHNGIDMFLDGQTNGGYRRNFRSGISSGGYSQISKHNPDHVLGSSRSRQIQEAPDNRDRHDMAIYEIDSRVEAEEVLTQMTYLIDQFDICTFADFLQMVRITPAHTDYKFGWEEIGGTRVVHSRGAYFLDLPRPSQLK